MAITHYEHFQSRLTQEARGDQSRIDLKWNVVGSSDDLAVKAYLDSQLPATYDSLRLDSYKLEYVGVEFWDVTASYIDPSRRQDKPLSTGSYTIDFDTTGGTFHITQSLANVQRLPTTAKQHFGAINVHGTTVEGIDIVVPQLKFTIRKRVPNGVITTSWVNQVFQLTSKTNNATFQGFAIGELLFLGAAGTQGTETDPEVTFQFAASPNVTGLTIGTITGINKKGHEYLWVAYESYDDTVAKGLAQRPLAVYVERIYDSGDFSVLGI